MNATYCVLDMAKSHWKLRRTLAGLSPAQGVHLHVILKTESCVRVRVRVRVRVHVRVRVRVRVVRTLVLVFVSMFVFVRMS